MSMLAGLVDQSAFTHDHGEMKEAQGEVSKPVPAAPKRRRIVHSAEHPETHTKFVKNTLAVKRLMEEKLSAQFAPFDLEVAPGRIVEIRKIELLKDATYSKVYRVNGEWVLKVYKSDHPIELVSFAANQLCLYAMNKRHAVLKNHMVDFLNFELHVEAVGELLNIEDEKARFLAFRDYVMKNVRQGFSFVPYIKEKLPVNVDRNHPIWQQVKTLFAQQDLEKGVANDIRRSNLRILEGRVVFIDHYEFEPSAMKADEKEQVASFTSAQDERDWLLSKAEPRKDR